MMLDVNTESISHAIASHPEIVLLLFIPDIQ